MKIRGLVFGLVVLVALAAFAYRQVQQDIDEGKMKPGELIFPYPASRVAAYEMTLDGVKLVVRRAEGGGWEKVEGPEEVNLDYVVDVLGAWSGVRFVSEVDAEPTPEALERYGLQPAALSITVTMREIEGAEPVRNAPALYLGKASPVQPAYYARINGFPRVVYVGPTVANLYMGVGRELFGQEGIEPDEARAREMFR